MHPASLAAVATAWSLHAALVKLRQAAAGEAADKDALATVPRDGLRSAAYGGTRPSGGHGDPVGNTCMTATATQPTPWATLATTTTTTLNWLADQLRLSAQAEPLDRIRQALPDLPPETAHTVRRWLDEADQRIRTRLRLPADLWPVIGAPPCPACAVRQMYARTSAPDSRDWTVICSAGCICTGPACPCGMPIRAAGAPHIWAKGSSVVEQHRATLAA